MKPIDPRHLVQFHEIIRTGSFTRAAETLGLTQPALTRNMKVMEGRLGFEVLVRSRQGIIPTSIGVRILEQAASVVLAERRINALTQMLGDVQESTLHIGCTVGAAQYLLPQSVMNFARQSPLVRLDVQSASASELIGRLVKGGVEIVFGPLDIAGQVSGLHQRELCRIPLVVAAARTHALAQKTAIRKEDLKGQRWALCQQGTAELARAEDLLYLLGLLDEIVPTMLPASMLPSFLQMGDHLGILPRYMLQTPSDVASQGDIGVGRDLIALDTGQLEAGFVFGALWRADTTPSAPATAFIDQFAADIAMR